MIKDSRHTVTKVHKIRKTAREEERNDLQKSENNENDNIKP